MRLRIRSTDKNLAVFWGTVDNIRGAGNRVETDFTPNGNWQRVSATFEVPEDGWLTLFGLDFGEGEGAVELDSAELSRNGERVRAWDFG